MKLFLLLFLSIISITSIAQELPPQKNYFTQAFKPLCLLGRHKKDIKLQFDDIFLKISRSKKKWTFRFSTEALQYSDCNPLGTQYDGNKISFEMALQDSLNLECLVSRVADSVLNLTQNAIYIRKQKSEKWKYIGRFVKKLQANSAYFAGPKSTGYLQDEDSAWVHQDQMKYLSKHLKDSAAQMAHGFYYKIVECGNGTYVQLSDTIAINYKGTLRPTDLVINDEDQKSAQLPIMQLIKGCRLALQDLKEGSKLRIWLPSAMGYGIQNLALAIPPQCLMAIDIELVQIKNKMEPKRIISKNKKRKAVFRKDLYKPQFVVQASLSVVNGLGPSQIL